MQPAQLQAEVETFAAQEERARIVVHFDGPLAAESRTALTESGIRLLDYLGGYAYFAVLQGDVDPARAALHSSLVAVEAIDPQNKLHPDLSRGVVHPWTVVTAASGEVAVNVLFHRDVDASREAEAVLARHGGRVHSFIDAVNGVVAHIAAGEVRGLAAEGPVMWVEPPLPALGEVNDSNRARVGANTVQDLPYGLDGSGVDVLVYDGGRVVLHQDLAGRLVLGDTSGASSHATHVACTVAGDGAGSGGSLRGMAPAANVISYGFQQEGGLHQGFLYTDPGDIEADYTEAITIHGADLSNNSIGTNVAANGFPCEWEGNYGVTGALIDEIVRGAIDGPFRVVWANGNERGPGSCGVGYRTTPPPACAKNHIAVGALNSNDDSLTGFSSWGPCDDGRLKPDLSAPGCQSSGDLGVTSCSSSGSYSVKCGTSMASPTVAGISALLLQQFRSSFPADPDPRNSTLKAILAQTAEDLAPPGPDFRSGYGSIRAVPAADLVASGRFVELEVSQGEVLTSGILVGPDDTQLKITLAWDDPAGTPDVNPVLVNDLDLRIVDPGGTSYYPWTLDPASPTAPAVRTQRDGVNNIEQVVIDAPVPGFHKIEVEGFNIAEGPTQPFGLAANLEIVACESAALLLADAARVTCEADLQIRVIDCDPNGDDTTIDTVTVDADSQSEPGGETVVLTEVAPFSASFEGSLALSASDAAGVLQVADGEIVTVTYLDADDGAGGTNILRTVETLVDCVAPALADVTVTDVSYRTAALTVAVDEPSGVTLRFGTDCGSLTGAIASTALATVHPFVIEDLVDDTAYYFAFDVVDEAGNLTVADNGGSCFSFTTLRIRDYFTEHFVTGIDLEGGSVTFLPDGSEDFYRACTEALEQGLPSDPTGGVELDLGDDAPAQVSIGAGKRLLLYGDDYGEMFVSPNGYVTFGEGDSSYDETLEAHFDLPRVAALFDDLQPNFSGTVGWKQFADRVAVTWESVPEYDTNTSNTFQVEMFFDGRIRLSWSDLDAADAIAGLSAGAGLDPDFFASDLTANPVCGPRPPIALNLALETTVGDRVTAVLANSDDGLPLPGSVAYRIVELPAFGALIDPATGGTIVAVPYDLAGDVVIYQPLPGFGGQDTLLYTADDGGAPPEGGESIPASVTIDVTTGAPEPAHEFLTNDADPGWSVTGGWAFGQPSGGGSHDGDPTSGATGSNVFGYNLDGDYADGMGEEFLTSLPVDLTNITGATLEFQRWLGVEGSVHDHAAVRLSTDGVDWTTVWNHLGPALSSNSWSTQSIDVSALADGEQSVLFRWVMGSTDEAVTYPGWNIDDIRVIGVVRSTCSRLPGAVSNLRFAADRETLEWTFAPVLGEDPPVYDAIRSTLPSEFVAGAVCVEADGENTFATDTDVPPPAALFHYLVRAENDCGASSLGADRLARPCAP